VSALAKPHVGQGSLLQNLRYSSRRVAAAFIAASVFEHGSGSNFAEGGALPVVGSNAKKQLVFTIIQVRAGLRTSR